MTIISKVLKRAPQSRQRAQSTVTNLYPGMYSPGRYSRVSTGAKWDNGLSNDGSSPLIDNYRSRQNSRSAFLDSVQYHAMLRRSVDTTISRGLRVRPSPVASILGRSEDELAAWSESTAERFHLWANSLDVHRAGNMNYYQLQALKLLCRKRDGEYFLRFYYDKNPKLLSPLQLALVDPNEIRGDAGATSTWGFNHFLDSGIERDATGREVAYHFWVWDQAKRNYIKERIPAFASNGLPLMVHGFRQDWPTQIRGYAEAHHALQEIENLTDFSLAHIKKAVNQSQITMVVEPGDSPATNPFEGITGSGSGPSSAEYVSQAQTPGYVSDLGDRFSYVPVGEATMSAPGSTVVVGLDSNEKLKPFVDSSPSDNYSDFVDSFFAHISASMSMPIELVLQRFNQNYSASRAALILYWDVVNRERDEEVSNSFGTVYKTWLSLEIARGRIVAPGFSDPLLQAAWSAAEWTGAPMPNIDPSKTAKADQMYVAMGATNLERVAHNYSGTSFKKNKAQLAREYDGLPQPPFAKATPSTADTSTPKKPGVDDAEEGDEE